MKSFKEKIVIPSGAVWLMNTISEYKGKQELYKKQSPQVLKNLVELAIVESATSSNRIEGITVEKERLRPILAGRSRPRDRSEEEVVGYRNALRLIHNKFRQMDISPENIKKLHRLCMPDVHDSGRWKEKDNDLIKRHSDGQIEVIFRPVPAKDTPGMISNLCLAYRQSIDQWRYPPLYAIACLVLDFLCIHPFRDGNGRVSRLLTLLAMYQQNYEVGRYISLEKIVENSKETYYEALHKSSHGWHSARHDIEPWLYYFLGTINTAYIEFEKRALNTKVHKGTKTVLIEEAIREQTGKFTLGDIVSALPGISKDMVKLIFKRLSSAGKIKCLGKGHSAQWVKMPGFL